MESQKFPTSMPVPGSQTRRHFHARLSPRTPWGDRLTADSWLDLKSLEPSSSLLSTSRIQNHKWFATHSPLPKTSSQVRTSLGATCLRQAALFLSLHGLVQLSFCFVLLLGSKDQNCCQGGIAIMVNHGSSRAPRQSLRRTDGGW